MTIRPASSRHRDRRDSQTPALITAINIEGAGSATVVYPNALVLQFGFNGNGWKRLTDVPFKELRHCTANMALEQQLVNALRVGRREAPNTGGETQTRLIPLPADGHRSDALAELSSSSKPKCDLRRWLKPGSIWDTAYVAQADLATSSKVISGSEEQPVEPKSGLRKWMKTDLSETDAASSAVKEPTGQSFWDQSGGGSTVAVENDTGLESNGNSSLGAGDFCAETLEATADTARRSELQAEPHALEPAAKRVKADQTDALENAHVITTSLVPNASEASVILQPACVIAQAEDDTIQPLANEHEEARGLPSSPPSSPVRTSTVPERSTWTPSPQKVSGTRYTPSPPRGCADGHFQAFISAVAQVFRSEKVSHLSKADLFDHLNQNRSECTKSAFESRLNRMDSLDKVAVIDDVVFSLA